MTTVDIPIGTTVFVNWYGHTVPAEVIDRAKHCTHPWSDEWIPVEMTVPGSDGKPIVPGRKNISMFHMHHVYATTDEAQAAWQEYQQQWQNRHTAPVVTPRPAEATVPAVSTAGEQPVTLPEAKARYLQFKKEHWDHAQNRLQVSALDDFYALWRTCIALKRGQQVSLPVPSVAVSQQTQPTVSVDVGSPDGDRSSTIIVDTETGEILPVADGLPVSNPHQEPQPATVPAASAARMPKPDHSIPVPTKQQQRSTGRIQYRDTIQTSIFD